MHTFENFDVMSQPEYAQCGLCVHYEYAWTSLMAADQVITLQCQTFYLIILNFTMFYYTLMKRCLNVMSYTASETTTPAVQPECHSISTS